MADLGLSFLVDPVVSFGLHDPAENAVNGPSPRIHGFGLGVGARGGLLAAAVALACLDGFGWLPNEWGEDDRAVGEMKSVQAGRLGGLCSNWCNDVETTGLD